MKKLLLTLIVTMLTCIGMWAQGTVTENPVQLKQGESKSVSWSSVPNGDFIPKVNFSKGQDVVTVNATGGQWGSSVKIDVVGLEIGEAEFTVSLHATVWNGSAKVPVDEASATSEKIVVNVVDNGVKVEMNSENPLELDKDAGAVFIPYSITNAPSNYGTRIEFNEAVVNAEMANWDGKANGTYVKLTPNAAGTTTLSLVLYNNGYGLDHIVFAKKDLTVNVIDKECATTLEAIADQTVALGYTTKVPVTFAPSTAILSVTSSNSNIGASYINGVITLSADASVAENEESTITITPKAGSAAEAVTFTATTVAPKGINTIALAVDKENPMAGEKVTIIPTFDPVDPASTELTWTSSNDEFATVENGVVTAKKRGTVTITATSASINGADPVVATATINVKEELPVTDIQPKTVFRVGETYTSPLEMVSGSESLLASKKYWSSDNNIVSIDETTGYLVAKATGIVNISSKFTPTADALADNYVAWERGMKLYVKEGEYGLTLSSAVISGTTATTSVTGVTLNGEAISDDTKYSIAYSLEGAADKTTIDPTTGVVTLPSSGLAQQFAIVATLTPNDADNYKGGVAKTAVLITNPTAKVEISVDAAGVYTVSIPSPGAFGSQLSDDPTSGDAATAKLIDDATLQGLRDAETVKVTGLLANSDVRELINLIGFHSTSQSQCAAGPCKTLDMGGAKMTEAIGTIDCGQQKIKWNWVSSNNNKVLASVKNLTLPQPAVGVENGTVLPEGFAGAVGGWYEVTFTALETLTIPEGWTETADGFSSGVGANVFAANASANKNGLTSLNLPSSLEKIGEYSFYDIQVHTLYMPKNLKYVGPFAFGSTPKMTDIYFTGDGRDLKYVDRTAFSSQTQLCNNSVDDQGQNGKNMPTINRGNYVNGNVPVCIMHFPKGCDAEYTDVTRTYVVLDTSEQPYNKGGYTYIAKGTYENGESWEWDYNFMNTVNSKTYSGEWNMKGIVLDGGFPDDTYGYSFIWPSQSQMTYGYGIANAGYLWNMQPMGPDQLDPENGVDKRGLYQFIIGMGNAPTDPHKWVFPTNYEQDKWYTFSVPFDMTVEQIKDVFGATTQVCRISKVIRDTEPEQNVLRLEFRKSVMQENDGRAEDIIYADGVTQAGIRHHYPYMIKPSSPVSELQAQFQENGHRVLPNYETIPGNLMIETVTAVTSKDVSTDKEYMFCPILMEGKLKKNSYVLTNQNGVHKFIFYKGTKVKDENGNYVVEDGKYVYADGSKASANTAYVQLLHGQDDGDTFFPSATIENNVKFASYFGDFFDVEDEATRIEKVEIVCGAENSATDVIYSINGIRVKGESMAPGLYIKNGKKYIVK